MGSPSQILRLRFLSFICAAQPQCRLPELLVRVDHFARVIVDADDGMIRSTAVLCVSDSVRDCIRPVVPQPTKCQRIGNEVNAAFIFARADFITCVRCNAIPAHALAASISPRHSTRAIACAVRDSMRQRRK